MTAKCDMLKLAEYPWLCTDMEICLVYGLLWRFVAEFSQSVILTRSGQIPSCGVGGRRGDEVEDPVLVRFNTVSLGRKFRKFRIIIVALSWKVWEVRHSYSWHNDATLYLPHERRPGAVSGSVYKSKSDDCPSSRLQSFHRLYTVHCTWQPNVRSLLDVASRTRRSYATRD
jgi:hypothetical protein